MVENVGPTSLTLSWSTDVDATSVVEYGLFAQQKFEFIKEGTLFTRQYRVTLEDLQASTTYIYRIIMKRNGESSASDVFSVDTKESVTGNEDVPTVAGCQLFPEDNMWNTRADNLPVHPNSDQYINSIGLTTNLHPDFGTTWQGMDLGVPYQAISGSQPYVDIAFDYWDETDPLQQQGVIKQYPLPNEPIIEGGSDKHVLLVEQSNCVLYELYNVRKNGVGQWEAGSGAIWNLDQNEIRPEGVTSADAAGLAILPGLVRYDEVYGYVRPASHSDGRNGNNPVYPPKCG